MKKQNQREKHRHVWAVLVKIILMIIFLLFIWIMFYCDFSTELNTTSIACISLIIITTNLTVINKETSHFWVG